MSVDATAASTDRRALHTSGWALAFGAWLLFLVGCYLRVWGDAGSAAYRSISESLPAAFWGTALSRNLISFTIAQVALHCGLAFLCIMLGMVSRLAWRTLSCSQTLWILLWCIALMLWTLLANATWFPTSSLGAPYASIAAAHWERITPLTFLSILLLLAIGTACGRALRSLRPRPFSPLIRFALPAIVIAVALGTVAASRGAHSGPIQVQPNIIIVGIDSLRPDAVNAQDMPAIHRFLSESTRFTDATTPLARTFPSWVTVLTGRHPHTTGATTNLLPRDLIQTSSTLPQLAQKAGYATVYAIDEVRFSNLDTSYGFDRMIAPMIGATDFTLGFFADAPLSNVITNTALGRILFPFTHANRAVAHLYDPDTFVRRIEQDLPAQDPLLLATHFTLCHWPFVWAGEPAISPSSLSAMAPAYQRATKRVDQQFATFMAMLERRGLFQNALVIVLSDHGEALHAQDNGGVHDDADLASALDVTNTLGHGTSVFARDQYHVVLGFKAFGPAFADARNWPARAVDAPTSLEDVTPTLVELLGLQNSEPFDGRSLLPLLRGAEAAETSWQRIRFTETEFNPGKLSPLLSMGSALQSQTLRGALELYEVDPISDRVTLRRETLDLAMSKRHYAAFRNGRTLAIFAAADPLDDSLGLAYVATQNGVPERIRDRAALLARDDAAVLWEALQTRFPRIAARVNLDGRSQQAAVTGARQASSRL